MNKLSIILLSIVCLNLSATDYYFSSTGNDGSAGTSWGDAWLHINNHTYSNGDVLILEDGYVMDTVDCEIDVNNILIRTEYGASEPAVLSGGLQITDFTSHGGNIYWAIYDLPDFPRGGEIYSPNGITIDNVWHECASADSVMAVDGDYSDINTIYLKYVTLSTDQYEGGLLAVQPVKWQWNTVEISSNTSNTIELSDDLGYTAYDTQYEKYAKAYNLDEFLTSDGDWTFRNDTLRVYSTTNPNARNIRFSAVDTILYNNGGDNFKIQNVQIEQANHIGLLSIEGTGVSIDSCIFNSISGYAIRNSETDTILVYNSKFEDILDHAVTIRQVDSAHIKGNYFNRISITEGLANYDYGAGGNNGGALRASAMNDYGSAYYEYNYFDSCGLATQFFSDHNYTTSIFRYNWIENYGISYGDNAAIYWASEPWSVGVYRMNNNNFVINSITFAEDGRYSHNTNPVRHPSAIYNDADAWLMQNDSNTIYKCHGVAMKNNRRNRSSFNHNRVAFAASGQSNDFYNIQWLCNQQTGESTSSADRDSIYYNQIVMPGTSAAAIYARHTTTSTISDGYDNNVFYFDYNKYAYPFGTYTNVGKYVVDYGSGYNTYSLAQMQSSGSNSVATNNQDVNSSQHMQNDLSGKSYTEEEYILVLKNYSTESHTFDLDAANTYRDIDSSLVTTSIEVPAMYSEILFKQSGLVVDMDVYFDSTLVYFMEATEVEEPGIDTIYAVDTIQAEDFDASYGGVEVWDTGTEEYVGYWYLSFPNQWTRYDNVFFENTDSFSIRVAAEPGYEGLIYVCIDSINDPLLRTVSITSTGDWESFEWRSFAYDRNVEGLHTLYIASESPNIDKFIFTNGEKDPGRKVVYNSKPVFYNGKRVVYGTIAKFSVNAGYDQEICSDSTTQLIGVVVNGIADSVRWSGSTGLINSDNDTAIYTPTYSDIVNESITLTFTVYKEGISYSDDLEITINPCCTLIAYYPFTGNACDSSGNGYDGTVNGATLTTGINSEANGAYQYSGGDYITLPDAVKSYENDAMSMFAWIYPDSTGKWMLPISCYDGTNNSGFYIRSEDDDRIRLKVGDSTNLATVISMNFFDTYQSSWVHIGFTFGSDTIKLWINGENAGQSYYAGEIGYTPNNFYLGANYYYGRIDEGYIYNKEISETTIDSLYNLKTEEVALIYPDAVGFGTQSRGAYDTTTVTDPVILYVDTLLAGDYNSDATHGSFEWAVTENYPRIVIFEVSGVIDYTASSNISTAISNPYINIYGQTAQGNGITLLGHELYVETHDVLIQHIKFRQYDKNTNSYTNRCVGVIAGAYNVVFDHCSFSFANDEVFTIWGAEHDITLSNSIVSFPLNENNSYTDNAYDYPAAHGFPVIDDADTNIAYINNLICYGIYRNPLSQNDKMIVQNNYTYVVDERGVCGVTFQTVNSDGVVIIKNNEFHHKSTETWVGYAASLTGDVNSSAEIWVEGNNSTLLENNPSYTQWQTVFNLAGCSEPSSTPFDTTAFPSIPTDSVIGHITAFCGAYRWDRDIYDQMAIDSALTGSFDYINSADSLPARAYNRSQYSGLETNAGNMSSGYDFSSDNVCFTVNGTTIDLTTDLSTDIAAVLSAINGQMPTGYEAVQHANPDCPFIILQSEDLGSGESITIGGDASVFGIPNGTFYGEDGIGGYPNDRDEFEKADATWTMPTNPHDDDNGNGYTNVEDWANGLANP